MNANIAVLIRTNDSLTQQYAAQSVCAFHAGTPEYLSPLPTSVVAEADNVANDVFAAEALYCSLMPSPHGGVLEVSPERAEGVVRFMRDARGTLKELSRVIIVVSPCKESQERAISLMESLSPVLESGQLRAMFVECESDVSPEIAFDLVFPHMREHQTATPEEQP
ncbi:conserved hypothetical protein, partial [Ricinus communis]